MKKKMELTEKGFTIIELIVAMAISLVVMAAIFGTFTSQQDSYMVQTQLSTTQQNIRSAMFMMTRDIQMAGYYTNFATNNYSINWDDLDGDNESIKPLIYARDNVDDSGGSDGIKDGTDLIVLIKASTEGRALIVGEFAQSGDSGGPSLTLSSRNLDGDSEIELNNSVSDNKCGLLVKSDLSSAELFEVETGTNNFIFPAGLSNNYSEGDLIYKADVVIYRVSDDSAHPALIRKNLGNENSYSVIAENIDNLQIRYLLSNGTWTDNPAGSESSVRAVDLSILARTPNINKGYTDNRTYNIGNIPDPTPADGYRRKLLSSTIKIRNMGL